MRNVKRLTVGGSAAISEASEVKKAGKEPECYCLTFIVKIRHPAALWKSVMCHFVTLRYLYG